MNAEQDGPGGTDFPSLPILNPAELPRRSQGDKYGGMFYLGIGGLVVIVAIVGRFAVGVWSMRDVWAQVHVLNDPRADLDDRVRAAYALSRDRRVEQGQLWEMCLRRSLPELGRYLLAEGIGAELVAHDPRNYAAAVARSPDWPRWLRVILARPMAYASAEGHEISRELLDELCRKDDPILRAWSLFCMAVQSRPDPQTMIELEKSAAGTGPERELSGILLGATKREPGDRSRALDRATAWLRLHHPDVRTLWNGWTIGDDGRLLRNPG